MGGLGNQLFQIFTTINYSFISNNPFKFLNIKTLGSEATIIRYTYWDNFLIKLKPFLLENFNSKINILREKSFTYNDINLDQITNKDICLFGYFQSYKYFSNNFDIICRLIDINKMKVQVKNKLDYSLIYQETISMHFRLGDYKKLQDHHPILPFEYYKNSLNYIINNDKSIKNILYFYEDDDYNDVKIIIDELETKQDFNKLNFIRINSDLQDWEQLLTMSNCKHNIIANSTFSWWGAYFNSYKNKIVCYPYKWFGPSVKHNTNDLFPESWIKIDF